MECQYIREGTENFMVINDERDIYEDDYKVKMLKSNNIQGLLPFKAEYLNNKGIYYYNITEKQSLSKISGLRVISYDEILMIITELNNIINRVKSYLLPAEGLVLEEEYIYIDVNNGIPFFCYNPAYSHNVEENIRNLFRGFLNEIDHSDRKTVELAYDIYCKSMKDNFDLCGMAENKKFQKVAESKGTECQDDCVMQRETQYSIENVTGSNKNNLKNKNFVNKLIKFILNKLAGRDLKSQDECVDYSNTSEKYKNQINPEETMLLNSVSYGANLISLSDGEVICLPGFPCTVGKNSEKCDVVIDEAVISRVHARFVMNSSGVCIEDMNSSNGTAVNGIKLRPHESKALCENDRIRFADIEYIYEQGALT